MSNNIKYDIFLSYEAEIRESILKLYEKLTKVHGLKVWLDYYSVTEESYENSGRIFSFKKILAIY